ncbi:MAG: hypothetical protein IPH23_08765 [Gammaproteobacteria bacterium]|nr:hypothetical protein [Gammaproteobacteria bacterium]
MPGLAWRSLGAFRLLEPAGVRGEPGRLADAGETIHEIGVRGRNGSYELECGAHAFAATARWAEPGVLCVEHAGHSQRLTVHRNGDLLTLDIAGAVVTLRVVTRRETDATKIGGHGDHRITATLPGQSLKCVPRGLLPPIGDKRADRRGRRWWYWDSMRKLDCDPSPPAGPTGVFRPLSGVGLLACAVGEPSGRRGAARCALSVWSVANWSQGARLESELCADTNTISVPSNH